MYCINIIVLNNQSRPTDAELRRAETRRPRSVARDARGGGRRGAGRGGGGGRQGGRRLRPAAAGDPRLTAARARPAAPLHHGGAARLSARCILPCT